MSDPLGPALAVLMLVFIPVLLLVPIVITMMTPCKVTSEGDLAAARSKFLILVLVTVFVLALWLALQVAAAKLQGGVLRQLADAGWTFFFPLWFAFAIPAIRARNPQWGSAIEGSVAADGETRTASFTNRDRENPVKAGHWVLAVGLGVVLIAGIAARGLFSFTPDNMGEREHSRWVLSLSLTAGLYVLTLAIMPYGIKRMSLTPEPLDARGSKELVELYRRQRIRRTLGLFWLVAVVLPAFLCAVFLVATWIPMQGSALGLIGGIGGSILGICGAVFGAAATAERIRIAELRTKLNSQ